VANTGKHTGCSNEDKAHQDQDHSGSKKLKSPCIDDAKKVMLAEADVTLEKEQISKRYVNYATSIR
jgi:hypothetical protein